MDDFYSPIPLPSRDADDPKLARFYHVVMHAFNSAIADADMLITMSQPGSAGLNTSTAEYRLACKLKQQFERAWNELNATDEDETTEE